MHPASLEISDPELARWLAGLDTLIWQHYVYEDRFGKHESQKEKRKLSKEEWMKIQEVIASGSVILTLHDSWGFVLYLSVWTYPASDCEEESVRLLTVSNHHLEDIKSGLNTPTENEGMWGIVRPFTHSSANIAAVRSFLPEHEIKDRSAYDY